MRRHLQILVASLVMASIGCGQTSYTPARSPRVSITSNGFVRDGATYSSLTDAVNGNARAEQEASLAESFAIGGVVCSFVGDATAGFGLGLELVGSQQGPDHQPRHPAMATTGVGLALGGLALAVVGITLLTHASAHQRDAVNIYNDGASATPAPASR